MGVDVFSPMLKKVLKLLVADARAKIDSEKLRFIPSQDIYFQTLYPTGWDFLCLHLKHCEL